jgi:hypothetical protein
MTALVSEPSHNSDQYCTRTMASAASSSASGVTHGRSICYRMEHKDIARKLDRH